MHHNSAGISQRESLTSSYGGAHGVMVIFVGNGHGNMTSNHTTVLKLFVLKTVTWSYNHEK